MNSSPAARLIAGLSLAIKTLKPSVTIIGAPDSPAHTRGD